MDSSMPWPRGTPSGDGAVREPPALHPAHSPGGVGALGEGMWEERKESGMGGKKKD